MSGELDDVIASYNGDSSIAIASNIQQNSDKSYSVKFSMCGHNFTLSANKKIGKGNSSKKEAERICKCIEDFSLDYDILKETLRNIINGNFIDESQLSDYQLYMLNKAKEITAK